MLVITFDSNLYSVLISNKNIQINNNIKNEGYVEQRYIKTRCADEGHNKGLEKYAINWTKDGMCHSELQMEINIIEIVKKAKDW